MSDLLCAGLERDRLLEVAKHFEGLDDPRSPVNRRHPLVSVMVLALRGILAGSSGPTAIAAWAELTKARLLGVLDLPNGIPRKDVFRRVLSTLKPAAFQTCFVSWLQTLRARAAAASGITQPIFAIDGKTLRRSHDRANGLGALHSVSLWAAEFGLTLGQVATDEKSNALFPQKWARQFPSYCDWSMSTERSSRSMRWGLKRPLPPRSSWAVPTTCWR